MGGRGVKRIKTNFADNYIIVVGLLFLILSSKVSCSTINT